MPRGIIYTSSKRGHFACIAVLACLYIAFDPDASTTVHVVPELLCLLRGQTTGHTHLA